MKKIISKLQIIFIPCQKNNYRPKFLGSKFLFYYLVILVLLKLITVSFLIYLPSTIFFAEISRTALIELVNKARGDLGINSLIENPQLDRAAQLKAQDMMRYGYFAHQSPQGITPWHWFAEADYDYEKAGENLGIGFLDSEEIYQAWNNSPSHKANLLSPKYQDIGIAVLRGDFEGNETTVVVQLFGSPKSSPKSSAVVEVQEVSVKPVETTVNTEEDTEEQVVKPEEKGGGEIKGEEDTFQFSFLKFMAKNYSNLVQKIIFYSLLLLVVSLLLNVFVKFNIQDRTLILKTVSFILMLILFILLNKEFLIKLIPHSLIIY